jgi:lipid A 3-O-deacylase
MRGSCFNPITVILIVLVALVIPAREALTEENVSTSEPTRFGMAITGGKTYRGDNISYGLVTGFVLFDYDKIWPHRAPEALRFKVEASAGASTHPNTRFMASANIFALYYLRFLETNLLRPYIEGGIGAIYTDFKVEGQGLRFNFNPQIGVGTDIKVSPKVEFFTAARLSHISNAGLSHANTGINSITLMFGYYF